MLKKLNGLNISKSPGLVKSPDLVNAKILKESDEPIAPVLSIMFKTSYETFIYLFIYLLLSLELTK